MEAKEGKDGLPNEVHATNDDDDDDYEDLNIVRSPAADMVKDMKIPAVSLPELLFEGIDMNYDIIKDRVWVGDVIKGTSYKFSDIKPTSRKIASGLTRLGFKKGDVLVFVTYDVALIYMIHIAVWLCGGTMRGCFQKEGKDDYVRQMREVSTRFILCEPETSTAVISAAKELDWDVSILSIGGKVQGALSIEEMMEHEDGSAFPTDLKINPKEDVLVVVNTSGSTGVSKGVMQTHFSRVAYYKGIGLPKKLTSVAGSIMLSTLGNFLTGGYAISMTCLLEGVSMHNISKFNPEALMENIAKYKPATLYLHPYAIPVFVHSTSAVKGDLSFLQYIMTGGAVINFSTAKALELQLPQVKFILRYGMSEAQTLILSHFGGPTIIQNTEYEGEVAGVKYKKHHGGIHLSCGRLLPLVKAKILDPVSGSTVGRNVPGNLLIKTPYMMKGYLSSGNNEIKEFFDENGWFDTGDIAYFDDHDYLYVVDRSKFTFKYLMQWVSPAEVEAIILKHPDVLSVVVVGLPDPRITSAAKAYVVLKPGSKVTEEEIKSHVAERADEHKHLHGGVTFVKSLPVTAGGKPDRTVLLKQAIAETSI